MRYTDTVTGLSLGYTYIVSGQLTVTSHKGEALSVLLAVRLGMVQSVAGALVLVKRNLWQRRGKKSVTPPHPQLHVNGFVL